jgi:hypothetical protein
MGFVFYRHGDMSQESHHQIFIGGNYAPQFCNTKRNVIFVFFLKKWIILFF